MRTEGMNKPVGSAIPYVRIIPMKNVAQTRAELLAGNSSYFIVNSLPRPTSRLSKNIELRKLVWLTGHPTHSCCLLFQGAASTLFPAAEVMFIHLEVWGIATVSQYGTVVDTTVSSTTSQKR
jgi:hypothetical protein